MEEEAKIREREGLLTGTETCSRDFLRRFHMNGCASDLPDDGRVACHNLELSLSLGGCFSTGNPEWNDKPEKKLFRSSSIASFSSPALPDHHEFPEVAPSITRTSSLPAEHEERRKRKEMQALRRSEAKRKRKEKMNSMQTGNKSDEAAETAKASKAAEAEEDRPTDLPISTSLSSGTISFRSWRTQGIWDGRCGQFSGKAGKNASEEAEEDDHPRTSATKDEAEESTTRRNNKMMEEMPCVSTRGDGPDGRRIEGFLYKYKKGEEVRIVCVCHGRFLTPAEFVKHAGGGDGAVAHPLRHIVVSPTPFNCL